MKYYLKNPNFGFVESISLLCFNDEIIDITLGASKVDDPKHWEHPAFRIERNEKWVNIIFNRCDNWVNFELNIISKSDQPVSGKINHLKPYTQEDIAKLLTTKKIVFLGTARSCALKLKDSLDKILELGEYFSDYRISIFENDSSDTTLNIATDLSKVNDRVRVRTEPGLIEYIPLRTERLAYARNSLLDHALAEYADFDYFCWIDLDGLVDSRFSNEGFLSNFIYESVWDAVFPITFPLYYDVWALREKSVAPNDVVWESRHSVPSVIGNGKNLHTAVQQLAPGSLQGWLSVDSAFGGFAIYKRWCAGAGRYVGVAQGEEICEHVLYNQSLKMAGAKLFINPQCITYNP